MPSSGYSCINAREVQSLQKVAARFQKMGSIPTVKACARAAAITLERQMKLTILSDASLSKFHGVSGDVTTFEDDDNVVVGIPPDKLDPSLLNQMNNTRPIRDEMIDLAKQAGDIEAKFMDCLAEEIIR